MKKSYHYLVEHKIRVADYEYRYVIDDLVYCRTLLDKRLEFYNPKTHKRTRLNPLAIKNCEEIEIYRG